MRLLCDACHFNSVWMDIPGDAHSTHNPVTLTWTLPTDPARGLVSSCHIITWYWSLILVYWCSCDGHMALMDIGLGGEPALDFIYMAIRKYPGLNLDLPMDPSRVSSSPIITSTVVIIDN